VPRPAAPFGTFFCRFALDIILMYENNSLCIYRLVYKVYKEKTEKVRQKAQPSAQQLN